MTREIIQNRCGGTIVERGEADFYLWNSHLESTRAYRLNYVEKYTKLKDFVRSQMVCGPTETAVQKKRAYEKSMQSFLEKIKSVQ